MSPVRLPYVIFPPCPQTPGRSLIKSWKQCFRHIDCTTVTLIFCQELVLHREGFILHRVTTHSLWKSRLKMPPPVDSTLAPQHQLGQGFLLRERQTESSDSIDYHLVHKITVKNGNPLTMLTILIVTLYSPDSTEGTATTV